MTVILTHQNVSIEPYRTSDYREEVLFGKSVAVRWNVNNGDFGILKCAHDIPGLPDYEFPVRLVIRETGENRDNIIQVPEPFFLELPFYLR